MSFTYDSFSEECANRVQSMLLDYQRCERADGTFYGTAGSCRKGSSVGDREKSASTPRASRQSTKKSTKKAAEVSSTTATAVKTALKKNPQNKELFDTITSAQKRKREIDKEIAQIRSTLSRKNAAKVAEKEKRLRELDREWGKADSQETRGRQALNTRVKQAMSLARSSAAKPKSRAAAAKVEQVAARRDKAQKESQAVESWKREFQALMRANKPTTREGQQKLMDIAIKRAEKNADK
jgi:FtsZ-interacting cell division protein ZipA